MTVCLTRGLESIMWDRVPRSVRDRRRTLWNEFWVVDQGLQPQVAASDG
jgi:hypothetical protein